jgi:hypothetical protein
VSVIFVRFKSNLKWNDKIFVQFFTTNFREVLISCSEFLNAYWRIRVSDFNTWFAAIRTCLKSAYFSREYMYVLRLILRVISIMDQHLVFCQVGTGIKHYLGEWVKWMASFIKAQRTQDFVYRAFWRFFSVQCSIIEKPVKSVMVSLSILQILLFTNQQVWTVSVVHVSCLQPLSEQLTLEFGESLL